VIPSPPKRKWVSLHATKPVCQLSLKIARQDGQTVLEGEAWCYTFAPAG